MDRVSVHSAHPHWIAELAEAAGAGPFQRITQVEFFDRAVSPSNLATLSKLKYLKRVALHGGSVSPVAIESFRRQRPDVEVSIGSSAMPLAQILKMPEFVGCTNLA